MPIQPRFSRSSGGVRRGLAVRVFKPRSKCDQRVSHTRWITPALRVRVLLQIARCLVTFEARQRDHLKTRSGRAASSVPVTISLPDGTSEEQGTKTRVNPARDAIARRTVPPR